MRVRLLPLVVWLSVVNAQDFMSFLKPFLGSGLSGNNEGAASAVSSASGIGGLLNTFASTGNSAGPGSNLPFAEIAQLGMSLLNKGGGLGALGGAGAGRGGGAQPAGAISSADYDEIDRAEQRREQQITQAQRERQQQMRRNREEQKRRKLEAQKRNEEMRRRREEKRINREIEIERKEKGIEAVMGREQLNRLQRARMAKRRRELAATFQGNRPNRGPPQMRLVDGDYEIGESAERGGEWPPSMGRGRGGMAIPPPPQRFRPVRRAPGNNFDSSTTSRFQFEALV